MSEIKNKESYKSLRHVYLLDSKFQLKDLGIYDEKYGLSFDLGYRSGQFTNIFGTVEYDDSKYDGKATVDLAFKHMYFGNTNFGKRMGKGHFHEKYLVSTNEINLFDAYSETRSGNVVFFADFIKSTSKSGGEFTLVEIKPYLKADELIRILNDINEAKIWKEKMMLAQKDCETAKMDAYIANANAFAAFGANEQSKTAIRQYQQQNENMRQVMLDVTLGASQTIIDGIEKVEGELDVNFNWHTMNKGLIEKSIGIGKTHNNFIDSLDDFKNGGMTESMKNYVVESVIEICGVDFVKNVLNSYNDNGGKSYNNMTKINIRLQEMLDRNEITLNQFNEFSKMANVRAETNFVKNKGNINSAIEETVKSMNLTNEQYNKLKEYIK